MRHWTRLAWAVAIGAALAGVPQARAQEAIEGRWEGAIFVLGTELGIAVDLATADGGWTGTMDIPQQGAAGVPLRNVRHEAPRVYFELMGSPGLATFDGTLEGETIEGAFEQAGISGTFRLRHVTGEPDQPPPRPPGESESGAGR